MLCMHNGADDATPTTITCVEEPLGAAWTAGSNWSCQGTQPEEISPDVDRMPELGEHTHMLFSKHDKARSEDSCNGDVLPESRKSEAHTESDRVNGKASTASSSNQQGRFAPRLGERRARGDRGSVVARTAGVNLVDGSGQPKQVLVYSAKSTCSGPLPERLASAQSGDGRDVSGAHEHAKPSRCTAKDPFWVYAKTAHVDAKKQKSTNLQAMHCLENAASAIDFDAELSEVPESELMTVQLRTREQRLDWRDFLSEAVAGCQAASLFRLFDVDAEPPIFSRPPPSLLTPESVEMWHKHARKKLSVPCVAPAGAGFCSDDDGRSLFGYEPIPVILSVKDLPSHTEDSLVSLRSTDEIWSEGGPKSSKCTRPLSPARSAIDEPNVFGDDPSVKKAVPAPSSQSHPKDTVASTHVTPVGPSTVASSDSSSTVFPINRRNRRSLSLPPSVFSR
eukprot:TRINITY_DN7708_c1_g1_i1.p1 TRINITY_DN7708_c1_g1~~TRINITY_DN7708_c1_g1_i1.p1  ORF type:complete len:450 (-),score=62.78 TRINITY_DN7708_c1_g1_i1:394-1743(-)